MQPTQPLATPINDTPSTLKQPASKSTFILILVVIILILLFIGLIGYFLFSQKPPPVENPLPQTRTIQPSPENQYLIEQEIKNPAINLDALRSLSVLQKSLVEQAILDLKIAGEITILSTDKGILEQSKTSLPYSLTLNIGSGADEYTHYFRESDLQKMEIFEKTDGSDEANTITISDLKSGDYIVLYEIIDLTKKWSENDFIKSVSITKINKQK